jgi:anti-anti-sigma factor
MTDRNATPYLHIEATRLPKRAVLRCMGEIDAASVDSFARALAAAIRVGVPEVEVDLREVRYLDSSALQALLGAHRSLARRGARLRVCASSWGAKLFHLTALDQLFEVVVATPDAIGEPPANAPLPGLRAASAVPGGTATSLAV